MKAINRLRKAWLSGTQLASVSARDEKGTQNARVANRKDPADAAPGGAGRPRRHANLWLGINVVIAVSLLGFITNIGGDTRTARLVAAISALLLGLSAIIAVVFSIAERSARQHDRE